MPQAAPKSCVECGALVRDGTRRCTAHKRATVNKFADSRRGSRHQRGYGSDWDKRRERVMQRDAGLCQPCQCAGRLTLAREVDHVVPKAQGGTDDDDNLQAICRDCHKAKTAREAAAARSRA